MTLTPKQDKTGDWECGQLPKIKVSPRISWPEGGLKWPTRHPKSSRQLIYTCMVAAKFPRACLTKAVLPKGSSGRNMKKQAKCKTSGSLGHELYAMHKTRAPCFFCHKSMQCLECCSSPGCLSLEVSLEDLWKGNTAHHSCQVTNGTILTRQDPDLFIEGDHGMARSRCPAGVLRNLLPGDSILEKAAAATSTRFIVTNTKKEKKVFPEWYR